MFEGMSYLMRGIITALCGLGGTFVVLVLIYSCIKLMSRLTLTKDKPTQDED